MTKSFLRSQSGMAAIETAFVLPVLLLLYFSMLDLIQYITYNRRVTAIAATIGDTVTQTPTTIVRATIVDYFNAVNIIMPPAQAANVHVNVYGYYLKNGAPTQRWNVASSGGPACTAPDTTNFASLMTTGNDLVVSVACMTYSPPMAQFMGKNLMGSTSFLMNQTITSRPRTSQSLNCVTASGGSTVCTG